MLQKQDNIGSSARLDLSVKQMFTFKVRIKQYSLPSAESLSKGNNINTCFDFSSRDITSNKNGISIVDEVVKESDGGTTCMLGVDGTGISS